MKLGVTDGKFYRLLIVMNLMGADVGVTGDFYIERDSLNAVRGLLAEILCRSERRVTSLR